MANPAMTLDSETRAAILADMDPPLGGPLPHFDKLIGDDRGNVWIANYPVDRRTTERFEVFAADGHWLGSVVLPPRSAVLSIDAGRILALQFDEVGVEAVAIFRYRL